MMRQRKTYCEDPRHPCRFYKQHKRTKETKPPATTITDLYNMFPDQGLRDAMKKKYGSSKDQPKTNQPTQPTQSPSNPNTPYYHPSNYYQHTGHPSGGVSPVPPRRRSLFDTPVMFKVSKDAIGKMSTTPGVVHHGNGVVSQVKT